MWKLSLHNEEVIIELEQIAVTTYRWRAVAVSESEREPIPQSISDSHAIAEALGALALLRLGASVVDQGQEGPTEAREMK